MTLPGVTRAVDAAISGRRIAGAVVLISRDGHPVHDQAAGLADLASETPMRRGTVFRLASVTKPVIAVTTMHLVEAGDLDLTSPIHRWLGDFRPRLADGSVPDITVDNLLTHTAGLSYRMSEPPGSDYDRLEVSDGLDRTDLTLQQNLDRIARTTLRAVPGTEFRYSLAYDVLGALIESVTGTTLPKAVDQIVCRPLQLHSFGFSVGELAQVATAYSDGLIPITDEPIPNDFNVVRFSPERIFDHTQWPSGGAGAAGTAGDVLRFLESVALGGDPILTSRTVTEMYAARIGRQLVGTTLHDSFARGWAVTSPDTAPLYGLPIDSVHWGGAYGHSWAIDPATRTVVVALTNTTPEGMAGAFPADVARAAFTDLATGALDA
ncbi:serine hydrolase domain-containing protein [Flexivirga oryzae]|uniref:CubicO group peptidase (Beta-lactamase class C family) n=1 Tax=Flexivirga oryzae TaxID=1794944 RepID=A0A839N8L5_9MICO|nr:serine hydrolase domain-containing protein [Flexivirga oryzae]MBB2893139.1 CubicO group peptidase (beta-lactamase class C family) [Flexivirga oryzae]